MKLGWGSPRRYRFDRLHPVECCMPGCKRSAAKPYHPEQPLCRWCCAMLQQHSYMQVVRALEAAGPD